ncbi:MAG: hypothetical protein IKE60_21830 [Reyranella sp.]|jgi:hypothetical protein|uniref:hypothetical protein n=1 Tax=Reyranella sp. TaxID=1929291 RepID=UPI00095CE89B|nr:hypothetical protein [Reyranella sp.]MBN9539658.1 hypothetical protein [Alphaproteobacteria bacterium]MBR2817314.1 hypothetical protein [Reyranella sp.]OJU45741.1 MAG: hypothetical protein BGN99_17310 [Alphaproteobacteria bacterium 65-37]
MTKKPLPTVLEYVSAAHAAPKRGRVAEATPAKRPRRRPAAARPQMLVRMEEVMLFEMDANSAPDPFTTEEIDRIARVFGLSTGEVTALYRFAR